MSDSCVPSAIASGNSPISQFKSILCMNGSSGSEHPLLLQIEKPGSLHTNQLETNLVARPKLSNQRKVSCDHVGNFRIATRGLLLDKQNYRLAAGRHLNGAERNTLRYHFSCGSDLVLQAFEADAHAVGFFRHNERLFEKIYSSGGSETLPLGAFRNANLPRPT